MGIALCVPAPCEQRVRVPRVKTCLPSSWLNPLKEKSRLKTRGGSGDKIDQKMAIYNVINMLGCLLGVGGAAGAGDDTGAGRSNTFTLSCA